MSEEEIIGKLKRIIKIAYSKEFATFELTYQYVDAIQGLLDLYNKEKEKNKSIEAQRLRDMCYKTDGNYISKDKIKEKIEEYEELVKDFEEYWSKDPRQFKKEKCVDYYKIEALKELLQEGDK